MLNAVFYQSNCFIHITSYIMHILFIFSSFSVTGKEWQWAESRAWLGSRWVWLQTQVSELEYRIRALSELYTHLRQGKVFWVFMCVLGGGGGSYGLFDSSVLFMFVQVRSAYSVPDSPLRASNSSPTSHNNCKSVDILAF